MIAELDNLSNRVKNNIESKTDYVQNGLLYCKKCNEPKQCKVNILNQVKKYYCLCKCEKEKRDIEVKFQEKQEEKRKIEMLRSSGLQDKQIINWNFGNAKQNRYIDKAKIYCDKWKEMHRNNIGLLFWGDVGTGKTFAAGCIANYLLDNKTAVMLTSFTKIINDVMGFKIDNKNKYLSELNRYKLLIIDDLGAERQSDFALEQVFNVIDNRYKNGQPLIITTNLSLEELKNTTEIKYKRIYDRILEMCTPLKFSGESLRKSKASEKIQSLKRMMEE